MASFYQCEYILPLWPRNHYPKFEIFVLILFQNWLVFGLVHPIYIMDLAIFHMMGKQGFRQAILSSDRSCNFCFTIFVNGHM